MNSQVKFLSKDPKDWVGREPEQILRRYVLFCAVMLAIDLWYFIPVIPSLFKMDFEYLWSQLLLFLVPIGFMGATAVLLWKKHKVGAIFLNLYFLYQIYGYCWQWHFEMTTPISDSEGLSGLIDDMMMTNHGHLYYVIHLLVLGALAWVFNGKKMRSLFW